MPVFFLAAPHITDGTLTITGPLLDHLRKSLRVTIGEKLWVGDDRRRRRYCIRVTTIDPWELRGEVLEEKTGPHARHPTVLLAQAMLKGDRMDWVIQKATELGVSAIVPIISERAIVRPRSERLGSQQERWHRIAVEAAQQSERWDVPDIEEPAQLAAWSRSVSASLKLILTERSDTESLAAITLPDAENSRILLLIGPEGGWSHTEQDMARVCGFIPVSLGPRILRAETAAIAALAILQSRLGEMG